MKIPRESAITIGLFIALTVALYFVGYWLIYRMGQASPLMFSVGLAAILTCLFTRYPLAELGWGVGAWRWQSLSYAIPLLMIFISYLIAWLCGFVDFYNEDFIQQQKLNYNLNDWPDETFLLLFFIINASVVFLGVLPSVLAEELAWRGLLFTELNKFLSFSGVALISGCLWAVWHWPLIINGLYGNSVTPLMFQLSVFTLFIIACTIIMTYLRYKTNSLWSGVIFHMSLNVFLQKVFTPISQQYEQSAWYIDEFGMVTALVFSGFALYFFIKARQENLGNHFTSVT